MSKDKIELRDHEKATEKLYEDRPEVKKKTEEDSDPLLELQSQILELRLEKGLSQEELAEKAGTKQTIISRVERGANQPSIETIQKIANALDRKVKIKLEA